MNSTDVKLKTKLLQSRREQYVREKEHINQLITVLKNSILDFLVNFFLANRSFTHLS